ncbi:MAG: hypothetical protein ACI9OO_000009 [Bacteroidia bacterium]|jgi:hypothetical protein
MMTGLAYLKFYGFYLRLRDHFISVNTPAAQGEYDNYSFDIFDNVAKAEWETLFFSMA